MSHENLLVIEIIDLEEFAGAKKPVPHGHKYRLRLDKTKYVVDHHLIKGRDILALGGKTPAEYMLRQKLHGGAVVEVKPDDTVDLAAPGVERFMSIPKEVREGEPSPPRQHFQAIADDVQFLNSLGLRWEAIIESNQKSFVIYNWSLPPGYNVRVVDVQIKLSNGYPDTELDMAHFSPALARADGKTVAGLSSAAFDGRDWQQWSRHRMPHTAWRMGIDDLSTHMALVDDWLRAELQK